ncbi:MAG: bifunctional 3-(3-hydroxy-phenyl)propionate/3-hydroxycinnamic acid hydroxylase, partial [Alphaproteobacteria bacterium]|nr:bifunctional 3-(3-hydroxy-phenyl)propionate/3-hydroxycinnamic acid hydroxylase [Alphaproteobacteria bacterium]
MSPPIAHECDVAIVGLGPVGAALANLLSLAGVSVIALERDAEVYPLPRAVHFDGEVMRVFHSMGLKAEV